MMNAQHQARLIRAEWQTYLAESEFRFAEDALSHDLISLETIGLEEIDRQPVHGMDSVHTYIGWFYDGEDARYETN